MGAKNPHSFRHKNRLVKNERRLKMDFKIKFTDPSSGGLNENMVIQFPLEKSFGVFEERVKKGLRHIEAGSFYLNVSSGYYGPLSNIIIDAVNSSAHHPNHVFNPNSLNPVY